MQGNDVLFSSRTDQWSTPQDFFDRLDAEFHFDLDPCADDVNHKCDTYFTEQDDGLSKNWGGTAFSAIRRMADRSTAGSKRRTPRRPSPERWLSC